MWRADRRRRRNRTLAWVAVSAVILAGIVGILVWATGGTSSSGTAASSAGATTTPASSLPSSAPPQDEVIAQAPLVNLSLPINANAVTAIAFRSIPDPSAVELTPTGPIHEFDEGASGSALPDLELDVGAPAGTEVYSPVDGQVIWNYNNIVQGQAEGCRLVIAPQGAPGVAVSITHLEEPAPGGCTTPEVGQSVIAGVTPIGQVIDLGAIETQSISQFSGDAGNHVAIEVQRMAGAS